MLITSELPQPAYNNTITLVVTNFFLIFNIPTTVPHLDLLHFNCHTFLVSIIRLVIKSVHKEVHCSMGDHLFVASCRMTYTSIAHNTYEYGYICY